MDVERVKCTQILSLPCGGREVVFERPSAQVHQTQVQQQEENKKESIRINKKNESTRKDINNSKLK